jgi:4-hydroxy-2-oxoheptanedioate aldolase
MREVKMRPNTVKQKWREGKVAIGGWLGIPSSYTAEIMAHQGFDWVCIDTQHGAIDFTAACRR